MITLKYWGLSAILFLLIAAPALYSYLQFLPEYSRGNHISLERSNENNLELRSFISLLFPNAPLKNGFIISDLTMRNAFIGLIPLVLVFSWLFIKNKTKREWLIFSGMIIGFLYAAGNVFPIHTIIFHTVPLMDHFRHPANARVFFTIAAVLLAVFTFNKIRHSKSSSLIFKITASIFATGIVIYLCTRNEYFYDDAFSPFKNFSFSNRETLKQTIDKFNNSFFIFSNALIQICFLTAISFFHYRPLKRFLFVLIFLNSFIFLQLSMPVTEVSKTSPADANDLLRSYTTGYPSPSLTKSIAYNSNTDSSQFILTGHNMFYNKNIGFPAINYNPTILNNIDSLLKNEKVFKKVMQQPFAFLDDTDTASALSVKLNSNNAMTFHSRSEVAASLHVQQTLTKNWKAFIDEKETDIHSSDIACMAVSLPPGEHTIKLIYQPPLMICLLITATITLLYCCLYLLVKSIKK